MTEQELIDQVQDGFGAIKKGLEGLEAFNMKEGRHMAANAAMGLRGDVISLHSDGLKALNEHYPELTDGVATRGGGGRD